MSFSLSPDEVFLNSNLFFYSLPTCLHPSPQGVLAVPLPSPTMLLTHGECTEFGLLDAKTLGLSSFFLSRASVFLVACATMVLMCD